MCVCACTSPSFFLLPLSFFISQSYCCCCALCICSGLMLRTASLTEMFAEQRRNKKLCTWAFRLNMAIDCARAVKCLHNLGLLFFAQNAQLVCGALCQHTRSTHCLVARTDPLNFVPLRTRALRHKELQLPHVQAERQRMDQQRRVALAQNHG